LHKTIIFPRNTIYYNSLIVFVRMKKRDRINIIRLILEASNEADYAKKTTKIMYKVLLNHPQLKEYWTVLTESHLISYDVDTQTFKITEKGLKFLNAYSETGKLIQADTTTPTTRTTIANLDANNNLKERTELY
jgi:predicted transcriptional regulator